MRAFLKRLCGGARCEASLAAGRREWTRGAAVIAGLLLALGGALAQEGPELTVDFPEGEAIPGQALSLRLTVLVPTFMPKPPVWPTFEAPNLWVRVASTGPTSRQVDGATFAGVTRRYLLSPMVAGSFRLPAQEVVISYADPETNAPRTERLRTEPIALRGVVPEVAEGLDPFIAADGLTLSQTIEGAPDAMRPGDSAVRTVTATIRGTSPMFLPQLLPAEPIEGVRAYADEPVVAEKSERGTLSGTRTERVTLLAEGGGQGMAPAVTLAWYDLKKRAVETAHLDGFAVAVEGPPISRTEPRDWRMILLVAGAALVALGLVAALVGRLWPLLARLRAQRREAWLASEAHAFAALSARVKARDHARLHAALDTWAARVAGPDPRREPEVVAALEAIGAARYGPHGGSEAAGWTALAAALRAVRQRARLSTARHPALPPLNPDAA